MNQFRNGGDISDRNFAHYASLGICGLRSLSDWQLSAAYRGHVADMGHAIKKQTDMGVITACISKGLRCITARALVKGRYGHNSGNKVRISHVLDSTCSKEV